MNGEVLLFSANSVALRRILFPESPIQIYEGSWLDSHYWKYRWY